MITRIELSNFMSHQHTVIEPSPGLTVLVGPNNCGKSAVVAALQILCTNDNSTHVMRHGEKECAVAVETDDGHAITWRRKDSPSYLIDGTEFSRLRQSGLPDELHQALRLPRVDAGSEVDFDVHFGTQKDPIFLLRSPAAHAAKFFASSSDAIHLVEMQKRHKEKLDEARRQKNRLEGESKRLTAELEALEPSLELDKRCKEIELLYTEIVSLADCLESAQSLAELWEQRSFAAWRHRQELELLSSLVPPPELEDADGLTGLLQRLSAAEHAYQAASAAAQSCASLSEPPPQHDAATLEHLISRLVAVHTAEERDSRQLLHLCALRPSPDLADTATLTATIKQLEEASSAATQAMARQAVVGTLTPPPELADAGSFASFVTELGFAQAQRDAESRVVASLCSVTAPPQPVETSPLEELGARLEQGKRSAANFGKALQSAQAELQLAETELRRFTAENACPTCGSPLDAERVLATVLSGGAPCHD